MNHNIKYLAALNFEKPVAELEKAMGKMDGIALPIKQIAAADVSAGRQPGNTLFILGMLLVGVGVALLIAGSIWSAVFKVKQAAMVLGGDPSPIGSKIMLTISGVSLVLGAAGTIRGYIMNHIDMIHIKELLENGQKLKPTEELVKNAIEAGNMQPGGLLYIVGIIGLIVGCAICLGGVLWLVLAKNRKSEQAGA